MQTEVSRAASAPAIARSVPVTSLVLGVVMAPSAVMYLGIAMSLTMGTMLVALYLLVGRLRLRVRHDGLKRPAAARVHVWTALILFGVALHFLATALVLPTAVSRAVVSLLPLAVVLLAGARLANGLIGTGDAPMQRQLRKAFFVLCGCAILGISGLAPLNFQEWRRPVFPFAEPSHFALAFLPFLMYVCATAKGKTRVMYLLIGLACALALQNLTLMAGWLLVALVSLRRTAVLLLMLPLVLGATQLDLSYYTSRIDLSGEENNLSNIAYLQGWQMIGEAWDRSGGWGIGFQQLGMQGTEVPAAELMRSLRDGEDMNLTDGTFVFAKLGSDFGLLGHLLVTFYLLMMVRSAHFLRRDGETMPPVIAFAHSVVITFAIELFVRGGGYFTGSALLLVMACWVLRQNQRKGRVSRGIGSRRTFGAPNFLSRPQSDAL